MADEYGAPQPKKRQKYFNVMRGGSPRIVDRIVQRNMTKAWKAGMSKEEKRKHYQTLLDMKHARESASQLRKIKPR